MAKPYFRQVPNFDYVSRTAESKAISDYIPVKNLFKKENSVKISSEI
jgi:hypothetical protein